MTQLKTAYQLFHEATREIRQRDGKDLKAHEPTTAGCACCGRSWEAVEDPGQAISYQYSSACAIEWLCTTCYTPRVGSPSMLGVERFAGGNPDKPVFGKLGMLPGSGGIITQDAVLHLALPQGFVDKFLAGGYGEQGRLHRSTPLALLARLLAEGQLRPGEGSFVYIEVWGRKADGLMRGLKASTSLLELWCNSENGGQPLDLEALLATTRLLLAMGLETKADKPAFWRPVLNAARGERDDDAFEAWAATIPDPQALMAALPLNPHSRLKMVSVIRELLPLVKEGVL